MNTAKNNKAEFKNYLESVGIASATTKQYCSMINSRLTDAIRNLYSIDLGSIFGVVDVKLLTHWFNALKENAEFNVINQDAHGAPYAAMKKYIEYVKHMSK